MGKKKRSRRKGPGATKKLMRAVAYGVADAAIIMPAAIPVITVLKELKDGHSVMYSLNTATQNIAGISLDGGDVKPDFGKLTAYALGSGALVLLGLGYRRYLAKRV